MLLEVCTTALGRPAQRPAELHRVTSNLSNVASSTDDTKTPSENHPDGLPQHDHIEGFCLQEYLGTSMELRIFKRELALTTPAVDFGPFMHRTSPGRASA